MIFDWKANAVKVLCEGKYSDGDKWERKKEYLQQLTLCAYLSSLGWDKSRIFEKWRSIPTEGRKRDAIAEDELEGKFRLIYGRAMEKKYSHTLTLDYGKEHVLYREEIDAINSLNSTYVFRKYLFNLLCVEKFYRDAEGKFEITNDIRSYCFWHANGGKVYCKVAENMIKANIKAGRPLTSTCVRGKVYAETVFYAKSGKEALRFKDPLEAILRAEEFVQKPFGVCPICGKRFEITGYTKREVCEDCYKKQRRENLKRLKEKWRLTNRTPRRHYEKASGKEKAE